MPDKIAINRAPVLTLWAAVVAERLGYEKGTALTLGKSVAGLNAQSKGQRIGVFPKPAPGSEARKKATGKAPPDTVELLHRAIPVEKTKQGLRAVAGGKPIEPAAVERYLVQKFGDDLADVLAAMRALAQSFPPRELESAAYGLYERFRPGIPEGVRGWGAKGELDLVKMRALAR